MDGAGAEGGDFFADDHGAEFGRDRRPGEAREHDGRNQRAQLGEDRLRDHRRELVQLPVGLQDGRQRERERHADEQVDERDDRDRPHPEPHHLVERFVGLDSRPADDAHQAALQRFPRQVPQAAHIVQRAAALGAEMVEEPDEPRVAHGRKASSTSDAIGKTVWSRAISNTPRTRSFMPARTSWPLWRLTL